MMYLSGPPDRALLAAMMYSCARVGGRGEGFGDYYRSGAASGCCDCTKRAAGRGLPGSKVARRSGKAAKVDGR